MNERVLEFITSNLAASLEDALRRLEAYRRVVTKEAKHLLPQIDALDQTLADSPRDPKDIALHTRAVQAVHDGDVSALSESIADLRGLARLKQRQNRTS